MSSHSSSRRHHHHDERDSREGRRKRENQEDRWVRRTKMRRDDQEQSSLHDSSRNQERSRDLKSSHHHDHRERERSHDVPNSKKQMRDEPRSCANCGRTDHATRHCLAEGTRPREGRSTLKCFSCGEEGHFAKECPHGTRPREGRSTLKCFSCGEEGHFAKECPHGNDRDKDISSDIPESKRKWGKDEENEGGDGDPGVKEQPNFEPSGVLAEHANKDEKKGVAVKFHPPPEACMPGKYWRFYVFKGEENIAKQHIHRQKSYIFGKDRRAVDIPTDHPSCSKQHAALCFRRVTLENEFGDKTQVIKPYVIDLKSTNGTFLNGKQIEDSCFVELFEQDVLKFGFSSRDYVLLHAESKDD